MQVHWVHSCYCIFLKRQAPHFRFDTSQGERQYLHVYTVCSQNPEQEISLSALFKSTTTALKDIISLQNSQTFSRKHITTLQLVALKRTQEKESRINQHVTPKHLSSFMQDGRIHFERNCSRDTETGNTSACGDPLDVQSNKSTFFFPADSSGCMSSLLSELKQTGFL